MSKSCADTFRFWKPSNAEGVRKEFYGGMNVRHYPADLCEFESGDGVADIAHVCLPYVSLNKVKTDAFLAAGAVAAIMRQFATIF
jgi:hypothetical protein